MMISNYLLAHKLYDRTRQWYIMVNRVGMPSILMYIFFTGAPIKPLTCSYFTAQINEITNKTAKRSDPTSFSVGINNNCSLYFYSDNEFCLTTQRHKASWIIIRLYNLNYSGFSFWDRYPACKANHQLSQLQIKVKRGNWWALKRIKKIYNFCY